MVKHVLVRKKSILQNKGSHIVIIGCLSLTWSFSIAQALTGKEYEDAYAV